MDAAGRHIVMVASENGALKGGKVGGVADVVRDLPRALASIGCRVTIIIPSYGFIHSMNSSVPTTQVVFPFRGKSERGVMWKIDSDPAHPSIDQYVFDHPELRGEPIYYNDPSSTPFLRDAIKYALFCSAAGKFLQTIEPPFTLHLHDWHSATLLLLADLHPEFAPLRTIPTAFTIHNLAIQGTRPMAGGDSSLKAWFPELFTKRKWIQTWRDARYKDPCYTPMAAGIRFSGRVNTVSPTYAREILKPSDPSIGAFRGEGLESLLRQASDEGRLSGILNGCDYPPSVPAPKIMFHELTETILRSMSAVPSTSPADLAMAERKLGAFSERPPTMLLTSITRVVEQKVRLLFERGNDGTPVIEKLQNALAARNAVYIIVGTGTPEYDTKLRRFTAGMKNIVYIRGYFEEISRLLYRNGDLFLMPSLFEPCGISQMMAMREGQPCLVHSVGGLRDTVNDMENGFGFSGRDFADMADEFAASLEKAFGVYFGNRNLWETIARRAGESRFTWETSARLYLQQVYQE